MHFHRSIDIFFINVQLTVRDSLIKIGVYEIEVMKEERK